MKNKVTVVIPTKDEERSIGEVIRAVRPYCSEIIVVDGHSKDNTRKIGESLGAKVFLDDGKGKGAALRIGAQKASNPILVYIDADGSHDPKDIPKLVKPIIEKKADLVLGSRMRGGSDELHGTFYEFIKLMGSSIITLAINYRFGKSITDYQNGFRAIRKNVMNSIGTTENIFTIEQEMAMKCLKKGYKVVEVPTHEYARKYGASHIKLWKVSFRYIWSVIKNLI